MKQTEVSINDGKLLVITPQGELLVEVHKHGTTIEIEAKMNTKQGLRRVDEQMMRIWLVDDEEAA